MTTPRQVVQGPILWPVAVLVIVIACAPDITMRDVLAKLVGVIVPELDAFTELPAC